LSSVALTIEARKRDLGGFFVGRVLPVAHHRMVGPFIFFDHMQPMRLEPGAPRSIDVRPHPHIGLSTITYLFDGEITHRDSTGIEQAIRPGELNWMTAGRGISHSERFDRLRLTGGTVHGIQAWVALPDALEETAPLFEHYGASDLARWETDGVRGTVIAGSAFGLKSRVVGHSPLFYVHADLVAGSRIACPDNYPESAAYIVSGSVELDGAFYPEGRMLVFNSKTSPTLRAATETTLMLLGGDPLGQRHIWWNFVSSRPDRIEQAKADWKAGRIPLPINDKVDFIPLPET
jgi:redox-sensitive bicupin YhaK (pirin superfamily)